MLVVSALRWPHRAIVPDLHLHRQRTLSSNHLSEWSISECVRMCDAHMAYTYVVPTVCNNIPCEHDPPHIYVHTYFVVT